MFQQELSSAFKQYSVGEVLEDKELLNDYILVRPVEAIPGTTGQQVSNSLTVESEGVDADGKPYTSSTNTDNVIKAKWLRWGSQRVTAPDVRRRMRVMIYRYADKDEYYWEDLGFDTQLKRLETVIWGINNNPNGDGESSELPENMHTVEFSSHTKQLTLRTSQANGEPTAYVMQFNLAEGSFVITDVEGNAINLDSMEAHWILKNSMGSFVTIDKNEIRAYASDLINLETKLLHVKAETVHVEAETVHTEATTVNTECKNYKIEASSSYMCDTPTATITGNVTVGSISTGYGGNSSGAKITGNITGSASFNLTGSITCNGINSSSNVNAPNIK